MGIFDFLKKIAGTTNEAPKPTNEKTSRGIIETAEKNGTPLPTDFEHLTKDGDLPFGWVYRNNGFTSKIGGEYTHFLNTWLEARNNSPKELYSALKSFVLYLDDAGELCKSKGECYELWFYEYLTSRDYIAKRKKELEELTANFDDYQKKYENKLSNLHYKE